MIQDIAPHIFNNNFVNRVPKKQDYFLYYNGNTALIKNNGSENIFPQFSDYDMQFPDIYNNCIFAFEVDNTGYYLILGLELSETDDYKMIDMQAFRTLELGWSAFCGVTGSHLYRWYSSHAFCGRCGSAMIKKADERAMICEQCGLIEYPKISPAVIVAITNGDKLLMSRSAQSTYNRYALIAGFTEIGETLESTVRREVMEETGIKVKNIQYYKNQPWGFSDSILVGFFAELDGSDEITIDTNELAEARWFDREDIPFNPSTISLTREMIEEFRNRGQK